MKVIISFEKKNIVWLVALFVFFLGIGLIIGYNSGANPSVFGHSSEELEVVITGTQKTLQDAIDQGDFDTTFGTTSSINKDTVESGSTSFDCPSGYAVTSITVSNDDSCQINCGYSRGPIYNMLVTCTKLD